jgi:sugar/nucleoside kinase (ribokinase family)
LTPKLRLDANDLSPELLASKSFHLICNPLRAISLVENILLRRQEQGMTSKPMFLWEPVPGVCSPEDWQDCIRAMQVVDITSPNVNEAAAFLGQTIDEEQSFSLFKRHVEQRLVLEYTSKLPEHGLVVFRCGKHGCVVATKTTCEWLPAFHDTSERVVDPTGGGNAFCGGFCAGWIQSGDVRTAAMYGNIAASFVIEQYGLPNLEYSTDGERWNSDTVERRIEMYRNRIKIIEL